MPAVVLLRHGATEWSRSGRHTGRTDLPLLPEGRTEAAALPARLARWRFAEVRVSPLRRARDTAELAGFPEAVVDERLREWDYGDYEGLTTLEIRAARPGWSLWREGVPGGEDPGAVQDRVDALLADVRQVPGPVLLVAHGHLLRAVGVRWIGQPLTLGAHLPLEAAALSLLDVDRGLPVLEAWNLRPEPVC